MIVWSGMKVKRRRFIQTLATAPAASALAQRRGNAPGQGSQPGQAGQAGQAGAQPPKLSNTPFDAAAETTPRFFSAEQIAALRKLGTLFMPPRKGRPGALEAGAPEFLDFLIGVSPANTKELYLNGLDALNDHARMKFGKSFADLNAAEADAILRPLIVTVAWVPDRPSDPLQHFVAQVHDDLRTATVNSREWANGGSGARRGAVGTYILPIDPRYRG